MVKHYSQQLDRTFFALSDPTRRAIIGNLAQKGQCTVLELAKPFDMSLPAISKHLKLLESANLVVRKKEGRVHYLTLCANPMSEANDWLAVYARFWQNNLDSFDDYVRALLDADKIEEEKR
jgi:DNA-binding transcriptional ArsR family regulator